MNLPWPEIGPLFFLIIFMAFYSPLWYGAVLNALAYLVVRRRGADGKMISCGVITVIITFGAALGTLVVQGDPKVDLNKDVMLLTRFVLETLVIIVGAVCCWLRPIIGFRTPGDQ